MIEEAADLLSLWMLLSAAAGFMVGDAPGGRAGFASISNRPTSNFE